MALGLSLFKLATHMSSGIINARVCKFMDTVSCSSKENLVQRTFMPCDAAMAADISLRHWPKGRLIWHYIRQMVSCHYLILVYVIELEGSGART